MAKIGITFATNQPTNQPTNRILVSQAFYDAFSLICESLKVRCALR